MGVVYKARQVSMDRIVALKVLFPEHARNEAFVHRFIREARSVARLNHPHIVQGFDVGRDKGTYYFAMEFVDGASVGELLDREGKMAETKALPIVRAVASALEHACRHRIVHRDIKPDNILIARDGVVKLADLGLARSVEKPDRVTFTGTALGTPYYMSPEQVRGDDDIDIRSDLYSLGATLYHMVTGRVPFDGPSLTAVAVKHVTEPVPIPRDTNTEISEGVSDLIAWMMAKDRSGRPQTPAEVIGAIDTALEQVATPQPGKTTLPLAPGSVRIPPRKDTPWAAPLLAAVAVLLCLALGGVLFIYWSPREQGKAPAQGKSSLPGKPAEPSPPSKEDLLKKANAEVEAKCLADAAAAKAHAQAEAERQEVEAKRLADAAAEKARVEAEARSKQEAEKAAEAKRFAGYSAAMIAARELSRSEERLDEALTSAKAAVGLARGHAETVAAEVARDGVLAAQATRSKRLLDQEIAARLKAKAESRLREGRGLLDSKQWADAEKAFAAVLALKGYEDNDTAKAGVKRAREAAAAQARKVAHDAAIGIGYAELKQGHYEAAERQAQEAEKHVPGSAEAQKLLEMARKPAFQVYRDWPFAAAEAKRRQEETARALGLKSTEDELALGGGVKLALVLIPAGEFSMGDALTPEEADKRWPLGGPSFYTADHPAHPVRLTRAFYLGKYEVTRGQFGQFVKATGYTTEAEIVGRAYGIRDHKWGLHDGLDWRRPGFAQTESHPAVCISWQDAMAFCAWVSRTTGQAVSLPTEAQWEFAGRSGSSCQWPWGETELGAQGKANVRDGGLTGGFGGVRDGYTFTAPVGEFQANTFGLHDMIGNAWEWVADRFAAEYYRASPREDPGGPAMGSYRCFRGGSWAHGPSLSRSAHRGIPDPRYSGSDVGFRIMCRVH